MEHYSIPAAVLRLAVSLLKHAPGWFKQKRQQADRLAAYCDRIADLLDDTVKALREGRRPHGNCAELDTHMQQARTLLREHVGQDRLGQVDQDLGVAYEVEYLDLAFSDPEKREKGFRDTESAAGRFRALATILRASGSVAD